MSFHTEYALAQYRAARQGQEPPPLPGLADPRARREFRDALLDARTGRRPAVPLLARLRRALSAPRREPC
ncbi:hypothetical protein [Streptomyces sp. DH37]|uniref:hypothetical protein n=1 Tax=Streptomyces sp. DH37 TaxID=3040122 RepID=UPI0024418759|nr:hypothetical protein [Streptomyces sp. DH37]MDG9704366.1 hypothetical protein [Streptomyces sp. DH37]